MSRRSTTLIKTALSLLHLSGAHRLLAPHTAGNGVIFMLHHVQPEPPRTFEPNGILKVTPEFLEDVVVEVLNSGFDVVALDEVQARMQNPGKRPFAVFTFDDGYRDNRDHAYPIFKHHGLPFAVYVASDFADGRGDLWWLVLEEALRRLDKVAIELDGEVLRFPTATTAEKQAAYHVVYWKLRRMDEAMARSAVASLAKAACYDPSSLCSDLVMSWDELRLFADDPLVTIGAHTKSHFALAKLSIDDARAEIAGSLSRIEKELGRSCRHFSYPYGCELAAGQREFMLAADLGIATAVTTAKGLIHARHANALTALPRLSLNGDFQDLRYVKALLSGVPFGLRDAFRQCSEVLKRKLIVARPAFASSGSAGPPV